MEQSKGKINFEIQNGEAFFSDEVAVIHNPVRFILDFKSITPRVDVRNSQSQPFVLKHNVIMLDPWHAKQFISTMQENIKNYEKQFGEIKKPEAVEKAEKMAKDKQPVTMTNDTPSYFV